MKTPARSDNLKLLVIRFIPFLLLAVLAWPTLTELAVFYVETPPWSHGLLIPLVSLHALLRRRDRRDKSGPAPGALWSFIGITLAFGGAFLFLAGHWYRAGLAPGFLGHLFLRSSGLLACLAGITLSLNGARGFRRYAFPIGFLAFCIPMPHSVTVLMTEPLRMGIATVSELVLKTAGVSVFRDEAVLHLAAGPLDIAPACSGVRSIWVLLAAAVACAHYGRLGFFRAVALAFAVPLLSFAANLLRVLALCALMAAGYVKAVEGGPHQLIGLLTTGIAGIGLVFLSRLLGPAGKSEPGVTPASEEQTQSRNPSRPATAFCLALAPALALFARNAISRHYAGLVKPPVVIRSFETEPARLPHRLGGFRQIEILDPIEGEKEALDPDWYFRGVYSDGEPPGVTVKIMYWHGVRLGPHSAPAMKKPPRPDIYYLSVGWKPAHVPVLNDGFPTLDARLPSVNLFTSGSASRFVVYWFRPWEPGPHAFFPSALIPRIRAIFDSIEGPPEIQLPPQYSVTLSAGVPGSVPETGAKVLNFSRELLPAIEKIISTH